eukprot:scaffold141240_cov33-Prasinocladus_malaysianus.AAC.2
MARQKALLDGRTAGPSAGRRQAAFATDRLAPGEGASAFRNITSEVMIATPLQKPIALPISLFSHRDGHALL